MLKIINRALNDLNYEAVEGKGIVKTPQKETDEPYFLGNLIPFDIRVLNTVDTSNGTKNKVYAFKLYDLKQATEIEDGRDFKCDIRSKIQKWLEEEVSTDIKLNPKNSLRQEYYGVFELLLKSCCQKKDEVEYSQSYGWYNKRFYWDEKPIDEKRIPIVAAEYASLAMENEITTALALANLQSILLLPLKDAGINHNFTTYIYGGTGVGKSKAIKCFCDFPQKSNVSLNSKRSILKRLIQDRRDQVVVLDDFAKTESPRMRETLLQSVAEIIQAASDASPILLEASDTEVCSEGRNHLVISAELMMKNLSSCNRCYPVEFREAFNDELYQRMCSFSSSHGFYDLLHVFALYVQENYDGIVGQLTANYKSHLQQEEIKRLGETTPGSDNRINSTYAVQMTISDAYAFFLLNYGIERALIEKFETNMKSNIRTSIIGLKDYIRYRTKTEDFKSLLEPLSDLVSGASTDRKYKYGEYLVYEEKDYCNPRKEKPTLLCVNDGYVSFEAKIICEILESKHNCPSATPKKLISELKHFSLVYLNNQGDSKCCFHTQKKYTHVRVIELVSLFQEEDPTRWRMKKKELEGLYYPSKPQEPLGDWKTRALENEKMYEKAHRRNQAKKSNSLPKNSNATYLVEKRKH